MAIVPGIPTSGRLANGSESWALIVTSPNWTTHNMMISIASGYIAVSIGDNDNSAPAPMMLINTTTQELIHKNLDIPPNTPIYAKQTVGEEESFTGAIVSVW